MSSSHAKNDSGRVVLWVALAGAAALLGYLTLGLAIPNNPLYSDRDAMGISKYKFIDACTHAATHEHPQLMNLQQDLISGGHLPKEERLHPTLAVSSTELVRNTTAAGENGKSWKLVAPMHVRSELNGSRLFDMNMDCSYDAGSKMAVVTFRQPAM